MKYYLAPMEGITGYIYRNAYHSCFRPMDKYFTPFLAPKQNSGFSTREREDVLPQHNQGAYTVPQILTNRAEDFLKAACELRDMGYGEINLNLGCPSPTVTAKGKGAGFLGKTQELRTFLEQVFPILEQEHIELSIKTRLGVSEPEEFAGLLSLYNEFPVKELIVHPRVLTDYYKNEPDLEAFLTAVQQAAFPVCYNGNLFMPDALSCLKERIPQLDLVMLGRGILMNPFLTEQLEEKEPKADAKKRLEQFHSIVYEGYLRVMPGERPVLFKMKELWSYQMRLFTDDGSYMKQIRKAQRLSQYEAAVKSVFRSLELDFTGERRA